MKEVCIQVREKLENDFVDLFILTHGRGQMYIINRVHNKVLKGGIPSPRDIRYLSRPAYPGALAHDIIQTARNQRWRQLHKEERPTDQRIIQEVEEWEGRIEEILNKLKN